MPICKNCGSSEMREETADEIAVRLNESLNQYHQSRQGYADSYFRQLYRELNISFGR